MNGKERMVEQSKQWLSEALIELMRSEDFQDISITEIAQQAELSRKTFYHSFKNKEALINYFCDKLFDAYFQRLVKQVPQPGATMLDNTLDIFLNFWWEQRDLIRLLIDQGLFDHMNEIWQKKAIPRYNAFAAPWHVKGSAKQVAYVMSFQLGGFTNILRVWLEQDEPESPAEIKKIMIDAIHQLANSIN
ncbi:TetR/AcrR family transcriptional regulator [Liquorilactobacillus mali]|uniref:TetR/AcrR family transcriptional regulator n=1 Tax=Liquorilactobacillus mali TaxID=1618 RepID=UPI0023500D3A|nr:TetR/AcrR family transcriptional regulator [Liquorilactobacillus mali]MDC7952648.1 TetR/AcrR family transcriptional regulator [Liquorilactobacillus mali]MDN7145888.1 TetR/AcrR family transcriptional regulator [Liquorilactobacillus mali]